MIFRSLGSRLVPIRIGTHGIQKLHWLATTLLRLFVQGLTKIWMSLWLTPRNRFLKHGWGKLMEIPEMEALLLGKSSINGNTIPRININLQLEVVRWDKMSFHSNETLTDSSASNPTIHPSRIHQWYCQSSMVLFFMWLMCFGLMGHDHPHVQ